MKPITMNNLEFAKNHQSMSGELDVNHCERLMDKLVNVNENTQKVRYTIHGSTECLHLPSLHLTIEAVLPMTCQRCMEEMQLDLALSYDYILSASEPETFDGDEEIDWLEISGQMNLNDLIEDELLMAIPFAPTHPHQCKAMVHEGEEKENPFAVLKDLIK